AGRRSGKRRRHRRCTHPSRASRAPACPEFRGRGSVTDRWVDDHVDDLATAVGLDVPGRSALVVGSGADHDRRRRTGQRPVRRGLRGRFNRLAGIVSTVVPVVPVVSPPVPRVVVVIGVVLPIISALLLSLLAPRLTLILSVSERGLTRLALLGGSEPRQLLV